MEKTKWQMNHPGDITCPTYGSAHFGGDGLFSRWKKTTDLELRITTKNRKYSISSEPKEFICLNLSLKVLMKTTAVVVVHSTTEPIYLIENERSHSDYYDNKQMQKM